MSGLYLSVVDNSRDPPVPVLVTRDPEVLRAVERAIGRRLQGGEHNSDAPLRLLEAERPEGEG